MSSPTQKDIAKQLGISSSTVSRVLSGKSKSGKHSKLIFDLVKSMNYQPNQAAAGLRTSHSKIIGVIVPDIGDGYFAQVIKGIEEALVEYGYRLIICQSHESVEGENAAIQTLLRFNIDGVMVSLSKHTRHLRSFLTLLARDIPVVQFDRGIPSKTIPIIDTKDYLATYKAGEYLVSRGLKSFLYIGLSNNLSNDQDRFRGFQHVIEDYQLTTPRRIYKEDQDLEACFCIETSLAGIDCIVCYNDTIAAEVLHLLRQNFIKVPQQISVCGFDDRNFCKWLVPALTSIARPIKQFGIYAAEKMLEKILDDFHSTASLPQSTFTIRESTR